MNVERETLWLGDGTWTQLLINSAVFAVDACMFANGGNPFIAACMGFHVGLMFMCIVHDRIWLAPIRAEIAAIRQYLSKGETK